MFIMGDIVCNRKKGLIVYYKATQKEGEIHIRYFVLRVKSPEIKHEKYISQYLRRLTGEVKKWYIIY